jgi:hypothetical protein
MNRLATLIAVVLIAAFAITATCFAGMREDIRFHLSMRAGGNEVELAFDRVGHGQNHMSNSMPIADLRGLSPAALRSSGQTPVAFAIERAPGRVDCQGVASRGAADGRCGFIRNAAFDARLAGVGFPRLDDDQQFVLTMTDFDPAVIDALKAGGYRRPDAGGLVSLGIFSIDAAYVRDIAAAGYRLGSARDLVQFKIAHVTPALIAAYRRMGYRDLSANDLTEMGIQGVTPAFIDGFARAGFRNRPAEKLIQLKIFNVTPDDVRAMRREGYTDITPAMLVRRHIRDAAIKD